MALDIKTLGDLIKSGQSLVDDIRGAVLNVEQAANALDEARQRTANAIQIGSDNRLAIGFSDKTAQGATLARIVDLRARIAATNDPILTATFRADLADEFVTLANSTNAIVSSFVTFTPADKATIADLIRQATLDAAQRKSMQAVLQGAVSLVQAGLNVAARVIV